MVVELPRVARHIERFGRLKLPDVQRTECVIED
jgi:hypothetical protein